MRRKESISKGIDYSAFDNPYTGIAAMVFVQAVNDYEAAKEKGYFRREGTCIYASEIEAFLQSEWADYLAGEMKLDSRDVRAYPEMGSKEKKNES